MVVFSKWTDVKYPADGCCSMYQLTQIEAFIFKVSLSGVIEWEVQIRCDVEPIARNSFASDTTDSISQLNGKRSDGIGINRVVLERLSIFIWWKDS